MKPASGQHAGQAGGQAGIESGCGSITIAPVSGWPGICTCMPAGIRSVQGEPTEVHDMHGLRMSAWVLRRLLQADPERYECGKSVI